MKSIKDITYKQLNIVVYIHEDLTFSCTCLHLSTNNITIEPLNINHTYQLAQNAITDIEKQIDGFLVECPKDYDELAQAIQNSLIWLHGEDVEVNPISLRVIIENFIRYQSIHK